MFNFFTRRSRRIVIDNLSVLVDYHISRNKLDIIFIYELCGLWVQDAIDIAAGQLQFVKCSAHLAVVFVS